MKPGKIFGLIIILVAAGVAYWAYTHSPQAGFGQAMNDLFSGSIRFTKNEFYAILSASGLVFLYGFYLLFKK